MKKFNREKSERNSGKFRDNPQRFNRDESPGFARRESNGFQNRDSERSFEKRLFTVTCAKCGGPAEVPFRPRENKPVYCSDCFRKSGNYNTPRPSSFGSKSESSSKSELDAINQKLDKIMEALDIE